MIPLRTAGNDPAKDRFIRIWLEMYCAVWCIGNNAHSPGLAVLCVERYLAQRVGSTGLARVDFNQPAAAIVAERLGIDQPDLVGLAFQVDDRYRGYVTVGTSQILRANPEETE